MTIKSIRFLAVVALIAGIGYVLYLQVAPLFAAPCEKPITYAVLTFDERFGISRAQFLSALSDAEAVWEEAAGRELFAHTSEAELGIHLVYGDVQKTTELGQKIDTEQAAYDAKKNEIEALKDEFDRAKRSFESETAAYEAAGREYDAEVKHWNSQGGAPPKEYEQLTEMREVLRRKQEKLEEEADALNKIAGEINDLVEDLNRLARALNAKVGVFNERAGDEFDQGNYEEDREGRRISIYEFSNGTDLRRVLIHEMGHALGIGHVENPDSIMYSYNFGTDLALSEEDIAALRQACKLD
ncbi:matrixin family metalloprotease [Candidatus Parcubacteria bacterium]|nr:matrixin family metalloprotease [Candidatus Parcubacteria bacterium]